MKELRKIVIKTLFAVWAVACGSFSVIRTGFVMDVPVFKYVFTILENIEGSGMEYLVLALGVGTCFYLVRDRQKCRWISVLSALFALFGVVGNSYAATGSLDAVFAFKTQFLFALLAGIGYYFLYKNGLLFMGWILERIRNGKEKSELTKAEAYILEDHPFKGSFFFLLLCGIPWVIAFFPGTLQWDAHAQLWMYFGVIPQTSYHPVFITNLMGVCIRIGKVLFHSDSAGMFLFTFPQFLAQCAVFANGMRVLHKWKLPGWFREGTLIFWGVFPYFPIWGFTMVKDTWYYISFVLFMTVFAEVVSKEKADYKDGLCMALAAAGIALCRNDGRYVVLISLVAAVCFFRRQWRIWALGMAACLAFLVLQEAVYMPMRHIEKGPAGESLSVPIQQIARCLRDHYDSFDEEELDILSEGFDLELSRIAERYNPEISDPVKSHFVNRPDGEYRKRFAGVWLSQFQKNPGTFAEAFLHHTYRYFYPSAPNYGDYLTVTYLGNSEHWRDEVLDLKFIGPVAWYREVLRHVIYTVEKTPVLSLLYGCGIYTYGLFLCIGYLGFKKRKREVALCVPALCILLVCLVSPVNGYLRYMMPVMASMPLLSGICLALGERDFWTDEKSG